MENTIWKFNRIFFLFNFMKMGSHESVRRLTSDEASANIHHSIVICDSYSLQYSCFFSTHKKCKLEFYPLCVRKMVWGT